MSIGVELSEQPSCQLVCSRGAQVHLGFDYAFFAVQVQ